MILITEGNSVKRYVDYLNESKGKTVEKITFSYKKLKEYEDILTNDKFHGADSLGKNLMLFIGDYVIRIHFMMYGTMKLNYSEIKNPRFIRVHLSVSDKNYYIYAAPVIEITKKDDHKIVELLNSKDRDILADEFLIDKAIRKLRKYDNDEIAPLLLDQNILAGVGNIFKNEALYHARVNPRTLVKNLSDEKLKEIVEHTRRLMKIAIHNKSTWLVFRQTNRLCKICNTPIKQFKQKGRWTYWCTSCQN